MCSLLHMNWCTHATKRNLRNIMVSIYFFTTTWAYASATMIENMSYPQNMDEILSPPPEFPWTGMKSATAHLSPPCHAITSNSHLKTFQFKQLSALNFHQNLLPEYPINFIFMSKYTAWSRYRKHLHAGEMYEDIETEWWTIVYSSHQFAFLMCQCHRHLLLVAKYK